MIAIFDVPFTDIDYTRMVNAIGLRVVNFSGRELIVRGEAAEINQLAAELDFEPKVRAATLLAAIAAARIG